ncbi:hypothetical protein N7462_000141 [Penicillium macrosclerotiorum]|uniref:uncharacterized protein n=1 Tax=Penicillium macrosclerotiorum TaxID=303699 RepID=UPI002548C03B|nr:uncharacterized protein N7462_000141 [Penicillium macrosclerotiorum]KAJ5698136.1 hypothetical protein N7462_000141 [Penicillium macrosclerotiorum]
MCLVPETCTLEAFLRRGLEMKAWMEAQPRVPMWVSQEHYTLRGFLRNKDWTVKIESKGLPSDCVREALDLGLPYNPKAKDDSHDSSYKQIVATLRKRGAPDEIHEFAGRVAKRVLFVLKMERSASATPYMSDLMRAAYMHRHPIESLKHIFFLRVTNKEVRNFIVQYLYTEERGLSVPDYISRVWEYGTSEYLGLLGTRVGRLVGYFVMGSFPYGTHRIARVVTYTTLFGFVNMRFDIELVPTELAPSGPSSYSLYSPFLQNEYVHFSSA